MFKGKKLLVVDDEPDLREILKDEFISEGADVDEAKNGKEALEKVRATSFDAVLSDIRMPGGDGINFLREVRALNAAEPIVFLITGFADIKNWEAYDLGADGFVTKPFHLDALRESMSRALTPAPQRWQSPLGAEPSHLVDLKQPFAQALHNKELSLGRGGIFVKRGSQSFRTGDLVRLSFTDGHIDGLVRWVRGEDHCGLPIGFGLENMFVDRSILAEVVQELSPNRVKAFIPQS